MDIMTFFLEVVELLHTAFSFLTNFLVGFFPFKIAFFGVLGVSLFRLVISALKR